MRPWWCDQALSGINRELGVRRWAVVLGLIAVAIGIGINW
jgi:hypothetical protein